MSNVETLGDHNSTEKFAGDYPWAQVLFLSEVKTREDKPGTDNDIIHIGVMIATAKEGPAAGIFKRAKQLSQREL